MTRNLRDLEGLVEELEISLGLAREAVLTFQLEPADNSPLSLAQGYLHQVGGALSMIPCYGAVLFVNEMEAVLTLLQREPKVGVGNACRALDLAMQALPNYVRNLLKGHDDTVAQLMEQVNELRAVRAEPLMSATSLFMPQVALSEPIASPDVDYEMLGKLQKVYQYALLGYLKQQDLVANQNKIAAVFRRLQELFNSGSLARLWRVASAFFVALVENNIRQSAATRTLLWELDRTMGRLLRLEEPGSQCDDLLRNLLYYIALGPDENPTLRPLKEEFALNQAFPTLALTACDGALLTRLDSRVVVVLSDRLSADITLLSDAVRAFERAEQVDQNKLAQIKRFAERLATTLLVIGQNKCAQSLFDVAGLSAQALRTSSAERSMANALLLSTQQSLQTWAENYDDAAIVSDSFSAYIVDDGQRTSIAEVRNSLESIKASIVSYVAEQWDSQCLLNIPQQFEPLLGAVDVIGLKRVALLVEQLDNAITRHLLHGTKQPEWSVLDALADGITGFEYYLDAIDKGCESEQRTMFHIAAQALEKLDFDAEPSVEDIAVNDEVDVVVSTLESSDGENDDGIDSEIKAVFIEEAAEVLSALETQRHAWLLDQTDHEALNELCRGFHTLKGSGRMVQAKVIGDLSWAVENMLNKILDNSSAVAPETAALVEKSLGLMPTLIDDFTRSIEHLSPYCASLISAAEALAKGESVTLPQLEEHPASPVFDAAEVMPQQAMSVDELVSRMADEVYDPEVLPFFIEEAQDLLEGIENALQAWRDDPSDISQGETLNRSLHTLKGGARMAGLTLLGDLSHDLESFILQQKSQLASHHAETFDHVFARYDELVSLLEALKSKAVIPVVEALAAPGRRAAVEGDVLEPEGYAPEVQLESSASLDVPKEALPAEVFEHQVPALSPRERDELNKEPTHDGRGIVTFSAPSNPGPSAATMAMAQPTAQPAIALQESVKISAHVLDDLVNLAGEASIARGRVEQGVGESAAALDEMEETIARLRNQVRLLGRQTQAQVQFRREQIESSQSTDFDPLELDRYSQLQQLFQGLEESGSDLEDLKNTLLEKSQLVEGLLLMQSRITQDLQENLMKTRLVPFVRLVPRLRRIVRHVGQELGKQVNLGLSNIEGEMDRSVLEKIIKPIEHMLRNAIDHGIESTEQRLAAGKPAAGNISVSFLREEGEIVIAVADDGRGLDVAAIRDKAIRQKMITADTQASDSELLRLIFQPGFSTAAAVSQVSGRGVGMDVVKNEVHQLGGSISIESTLGEGVEFTIRLPFTVSVNKALLVKEGASTYALPLNSIVGLTHLSAEALDELQSQPGKGLEYAGLVYQLCTLSHLLHGGRESVTTVTGKVVLVLVEVDHHRYAVHVEAIEGNQEIIIKGLGAPFSNLRGVAGATILASGDVVVILDLPSLLRSKGEIALLKTYPGVDDSLQTSSFETPTSDSLAPKTIMVVDDSVTVRKVTSRVLEREGFRVVTAKDGREATDMLAQVKPDLMLLDIEMPRMDGFEVARVVRESEIFSDLPLVMISSRTGDKHRQQAANLGVNKFLGKPYQEDELLGLLSELLDFEDT